VSSLTFMPSYLPQILPSNLSLCNPASSQLVSYSLIKGSQRLVFHRACSWVSSRLARRAQSGPFHFYGLGGLGEEARIDVCWHDTAVVLHGPCYTRIPRSSRANNKPHRSNAWGTVFAGVGCGSVGSILATDALFSARCVCACLFQRDQQGRRVKHSIKWAADSDQRSVLVKLWEAGEWVP